MALRSKFEECISRFRTVIRVAESSASEVFWRDELSRLRVFGGNVGISLRQNSLDFQLRESLHLRETVLGIFQDLNSALESCISGHLIHFVSL
jgi:hypothetical protein